jgi:serine/threonine-protein kinase
MNETRPHTGSTLRGTVLGSYRILDEIASGGMGSVFRAEHVLLGRPAAVKLLRPDLTTDDDLVQRFVNEARAVTASKHPGIVEAYDFGYTDDGRAFIVMELLEGEPLGRRLARGRLHEPEVAMIAHGIASALKAAHKVGVIHRDLKPDNVFLVPDPDGGPDRTKVLDFGIAKLADGPGAAPRAPGAPRHTATGTLIGTPMYMAPEQARAAGAIDRRADLYSLGCILYHMLVGRPPFVAEGAGEIIALQMFGQIEPPSRLAPVSPAMEQIVMRLLEKDPAARFDSAGDLVIALAAFDAGLTQRSTWPVGQPAMRAAIDGAPAWPSAERPSLADATQPDVAPRRRSLVPRIAGAIAIAAIGAMIAYASLRNRDEPAPPSTASTASAPSAASTSGSASTSAPPTGAPSAKPAAIPLIPPAAQPAAASATRAIDRPRHATARAAHATGAAARATDAAAPARAATGDAGARDHAIEIIRDVRQAEPPSSGPHTPAGSPMETSLDLASKPRKDPTP